MKSIFVLFSIVALSNASFLRDLANIAYTKAEYTKACVTAPGDVSVTLTAPTGSTIPTDIQAKFTKGTTATDTFSTADCSDSSASGALTNLCTGVTSFGTATKGNYTLSITSKGGDSHTVASAPQLCYAAECYTLASTQAKTAKIEYDGDSATNFTIAFDTAFTTKPAINAGSVALTCTEATDKKSVVCTSKKDTLEGGKKDEPKNYTLTMGECGLYTGIVLSVSSASFYKLSGVVLAILALLF